MKHAKKMILVEAPIDQNEKISDITRDIILKKQFDENYLKPNQIFNLDQELKQTLNRADLSDHEKWGLYNQTLQRFLFHLNEERRKNSVNKVFQTTFSKAPTIDDKFYYNRDPPHIRNPVIGSEQMSKLRFPSYLYNNLHTHNGHYDMSGRVFDQNLAEEDLDQPSVNETDESEDVDQDVFYQSACDNELPSDNDEDYEEIFNNPDDALFESELMDTSEINVEKKGQKRTHDNYGVIKRKRTREEQKPIYSYAYGPPLQRWALNVKSQINKNKLKSVLNDLAREGIILPKPRKPFRKGVNVIRSNRRRNEISPYKVAKSPGRLKRIEPSKIPIWINNPERKINKTQKWERLPQIKKVGSRIVEQ